MDHYPKFVIEDYLSVLKPRDISYFSRRENISFGIHDFILWALKNHGLSLVRIEGYFIADEVSYDKIDFTKEMLEEFMSTGKNFNSKKERKQWIENDYLYSTELKKIHHMWCIDIKDNIYDPFGYLQFLKKNKIKDLTSSHYIQI